MAKEYIKRESVIEAIENDCSELVYYTKEDAIQCAKAIPAADVAEVRHGRWKSTGVLVGLMNFEYFYRCTACGRRGGDTKTNYCPHCGALMDKEEE